MFQNLIHTELNSKHNVYGTTGFSFTNEAREAKHNHNRNNETAIRLNKRHLQNRRAFRIDLGIGTDASQLRECRFYRSRPLFVQVQL